MTKKKYSLADGINNLFGADQQKQEKQPLREANSSKAASMEARNVTPSTRQYRSRMDLINSIEDPELMEALKLRARTKQSDKRGRPRSKADGAGNRTDGLTRTSILMKTSTRNKIKDIAKKNGLKLTDIIEESLERTISLYETKQG